MNGIDLLAELDGCMECWCGKLLEECEEDGGCRWTREIDGLRAKLAEIRKLADSLGDRSDEPQGGRLSDRRLMEPLRRMLLKILDAP